jgi:TetR/AcrR family transcriptional repressor of nem operon
VKQAILDLAQEQMKIGGYENLSFAAIAEQLDITRANVHHHFKNKEGLAIEATEQYIAASLDFMEELAKKHAGNFPAYLAELESLVITRIRANGRRGACVCTQLIRENAIPESLKLRSQAYFDHKMARFKTLIIVSQAQGTLSPETDPDRLALLASSLVMGIDQIALASNNLDTLAQALEGALTAWIQPYCPQR